MTTVLADAKLGLMVADSNISDDDRKWTGRKVFRGPGVLMGLAGVWHECLQLRDWYMGGMVSAPPRLTNVSALILAHDGLFFVDEKLVPQRIESGREAIGSGAKAAICAYEALGWKDPKKAVQIVCRHDAASRAPVRVYKLKSHE